jgi:hypothetical protein
VGDVPGGGFIPACGTVVRTLSLREGGAAFGAAPSSGHSDADGGYVERAGVRGLWLEMSCVRS